MYAITLGIILSGIGCNGKIGIHPGPATGPLWSFPIFPNQGSVNRMMSKSRAVLLRRASQTMLRLLVFSWMIRMGLVWFLPLMLGCFCEQVHV